MAKHHYVYRSYEEGGKDYIGRRTCNCLPEEDIRYFGSFKDKTFKPTGKVILFVCETPEEIAEIEIELHDFFDVAVNPQFANRSKQTSTGFDRTGVPKTEEQKKAQSERMSEKHKKAYSERMSGENNPNYGIPKTEEWKKAQSEKMSGENNPNYGIPKTEEWKKAQSEKMSGRTLTEEHKKKLSERMSGENHPQFGVPHTEEHKKKISVANSGRTLTEETKKKLSEANTGEKHPQYGRTGALSPTSKAIIAIEPDGTQRHYGSGREATRELEIPSSSLCYYLKPGYVPRGKWEGWQFLFKNSENF